MEAGQFSRLIVVVVGSIASAPWYASRRFPAEKKTGHKVSEEVLHEERGLEYVLEGYFQALKSRYLLEYKSVSASYVSWSIVGHSMLIEEPCGHWAHRERVPSWGTCRQRSACFLIHYDGNPQRIRVLALRSRYIACSDAAGGDCADLCNNNYRRRAYRANSQDEAVNEG